MSLVMLDVANARIGDLHREAQRRRLVVEQQGARRAPRPASRRGGSSRLIRFIATATLETHRLRPRRGRLS
jgi:hypothetical protein